LAVGGAYQWGLSASALYPIADNAEEIGTTALGPSHLNLSDAHAAAAAAEGQVCMDGANEGLSHQMGGVVHRNGLCIYSGSPVTDNVVQIADRTLDSFAIPAAYWKVGKRFTIVAPVLLDRTTAGKWIAAKLYIGATLVMSKTLTVPGAPGWISGHYEFEMSFVVGALAAAGVTVYLTRNLRSFQSQAHADFDAIQTPTLQFYPMEPITPGLAINTTANQGITVRYACNDALSLATVYLQGLTIYST